MKKAMMIMAMVAVIAMAGVANAADLAWDPTATVYGQGYDSGGNPIGGASIGGILKDGDPATGLLPDVSYFTEYAVTWSSPVANVNQIVFHGKVFGNGGWFGIPGDPSTVIAPTVEYTTDAGTTWVSAPGQTDDYVAVVGAIPGGPNADQVLYGPCTFDFDALGPVDGVRLYGGSAYYHIPSGGGFVHLHEIEVYAAAAEVVPEPAGLGLIGLALLAVRRKRS